MQSESLVARSALGSAPNQPPQTVVGSDRLRIIEEPFLTIISLRKPRRHLENTAVSNWLCPRGINPPEAANGLSGDAQLGCCWFEPNAWLVTGTIPSISDVSEGGLMATTISDRLVSFRLTGPAATQVIAGGCNPSIVKNGNCARTRFAGFATVFIQRWSDEDYRLLVDVSIAKGFAGWLLDASRAA